MEEMGKTCYIIGPIGAPDSEARKWADFVKEHIVAPAVKDHGYEAPQRADKDQTESMIMTAIVQHMFEADLVIADLTDHNPNAFYELGILNSAQKPVIHLIKEGQPPPFDLAGTRAIFISRDYETVVKAQKEIKERIQAIEKKPGQFYSHVQTYMQSKQLDALKTAGDQEKNQIVEALQQLLTMVESNMAVLGEVRQVTVGKVIDFKGGLPWDLLRPYGSGYAIGEVKPHGRVIAKGKASSLTTTQAENLDS
jgi:nucleoside 2-deoxyribosyltransferase